MKESKMKKYLKFLFGGILVVSFLGSCTQKTFDSKEELMAYVTDVENGYTQQKSVNGIDFSITYKPTDVMVQQMMSENPTAGEVDSLRQKFNKYLYFNLSLSKNDQEILNGLAIDRNKFGALVNQLAFGMNEKVNLFSKTKDTIALADYIYPRMYGMGGSNSMLFVYPKDSELMNEEFFHITIEDLGVMTGEVGFKIPTNPILNQPELAL